MGRASEQRLLGTRLAPRGWTRDFHGRYLVGGDGQAAGNGFVPEKSPKHVALEHLSQLGMETSKGMTQNK